MLSIVSLYSQKYFLLVSWTKEGMFMKTSDGDVIMAASAFALLPPFLVKLIIIAVRACGFV